MPENYKTKRKYWKTELLEIEKIIHEMKFKEMSDYNLYYNEHIQKKEKNYITELNDQKVMNFKISPKNNLSRYGTSNKRIRCKNKEMEKDNSKLILE